MIAELRKTEAAVAVQLGDEAENISLHEGRRLSSRRTAEHLTRAS